MKKATPRKKVGRPLGRKPFLALRIEQKLYDGVQASAERAGRTLAEEAAFRLSQSFIYEEHYGAEMQRIGEMMLSSFWYAGQRAAGRRRKKVWPESGTVLPEQWLQNQDCYRAAVLGLAVALWEGLPKPTMDEKMDLISALQGRIGVVDRPPVAVQLAISDGRSRNQPLITKEKK